MLSLLRCQVTTSVSAQVPWDIGVDATLHRRPAPSRVQAWADSDGIASLLVVMHSVLSGSSGGTIKRWDTETGQLLDRLEGHTARVNIMVVRDTFASGTHRLADAATRLNGDTLQQYELFSGSDDTTMRHWVLSGTGEAHAFHMQR